MTDTYLSTSADDVFAPHPVVGMVWEHRSTITDGRWMPVGVMRSAVVARVESMWHPRERGEAMSRRAGWMVYFVGFAEPENWVLVDDKRALLPLGSTVRPSVYATLHFRH